MARSIADQCYPEDTANVTEKGCPLDSDRIFHASLLRNYVYCPGSLLDQAITCFETTTESSCSANAACVWTDRFFGVYGGNAANASTRMMWAVDSAISGSIGWLKGPHDTDLANNAEIKSGVMPFQYCAARWTINETALVSLYDNFSGWQKAVFTKIPAAALLGTAGQAITGTCRSIRDLYSNDSWIGMLDNAANTCLATMDAAACAAAGTTFTYDTATLESFSTLRISWYYIDPVASPRPPSPSPLRPSPGSASALRLGWAAVLLQAVMFALAARTGAVVVA
ncbi:hypothetical protein PLESTB_000389900 [Pleodorina starrii]|uniref:Uncharacterized protein n=1 Tax=Pleodorina starrii TaxID=330485 RepID=A0A9W6BF11_9CHLO|nr:hypothetical protein PLESTB_000389900 [Pleodorina starrii]